MSFSLKHKRYWRQNIHYRTNTAVFNRTNYHVDCFQEQSTHSLFVLLTYLIREYLHGGSCSLFLLVKLFNLYLRRFISLVSSPIQCTYVFFHHALFLFCYIPYSTNRLKQLNKFSLVTIMLMMNTPASSMCITM